MNDITQASTLPMHITMEPDATPDPAQDTLVGLLERALTARIDALVTAKFQQLVETHHALRMLDEDLKDTISELMDEKISEHELAHDHADFVTESKVSEILEQEVDTHIERWVSHGEHDLVNEGKLAELVRNAMDSEFDEMLESKLDNATISISL